MLINYLIRPLLGSNIGRNTDQPDLVCRRYLTPPGVGAIAASFISYRWHAKPFFIFSTDISRLTALFYIPA
ncbi:MAG TPA: hypothetical protein DCO83_15130 [Mucilaginibacter sp.]|nr:hypothetical protein [Mucilaginibacter sp.]